MYGKKSLVCLALAALVAAALVSAQTTGAPNELNRVEPNNKKTEDQQQQQQQTILDSLNQGASPTTPTSPAQGSDNDLRLPSNNYDYNNNQLMPFQDNNDDQQQQQGGIFPNIFPFDPMGIFEPRPRPDRRDRLSNFLRDPFSHFRNMDQQFRKLEKQAAEGQSISYFTRNGVGYKKVCTVERIGQDQQQQQQQQQQPQQQQQDQQKQ